MCRPTCVLPPPRVHIDYRFRFKMSPQPGNPHVDSGQPGAEGSARLVVSSFIRRDARARDVNKRDGRRISSDQAPAGHRKGGAEGSYATPPACVRHQSPNASACRHAARRIMAAASTSLDTNVCIGRVRGTTPAARFWHGCHHNRAIFGTAPPIRARAVSRRTWRRQYRGDSTIV